VEVTVAGVPQRPVCAGPQRPGCHGALPGAGPVTFASAAATVTVMSRRHEPSCGGQHDDRGQPESRWALSHRSGALRSRAAHLEGWDVLYCLQCTVTQASFAI
jgi:hypothetical protein